MKSILVLIIIIAASICKADLASQLSAALAESSSAKNSSITHLEVDDASVKAKWGAEKGSAVTLKDAAPAIVVESVAPTSAVVASDEVEVLDPQQEQIAAEIKSAKAVAAQ